MSKTSKQSQIESLQNQLADVTAQLEAERNTILNLESRIAEYEAEMGRAAKSIVEFGVQAVKKVVSLNTDIQELNGEVEKTEAQRDRAVKLATDLSATLVKATVYGTGY